MTGQHGIGLDMEYESRRRAACPKVCISLSRQGIVRRVDFYGIKMFGIKSKPAFRGSGLPRVEGAAFDQGLVGPGGCAHLYLSHVWSFHKIP